MKEEILVIWRICPIFSVTSHEINKQRQFKVVLVLTQKLNGNTTTIFHGTRFIFIAIFNVLLMMTSHSEQSEKLNLSNRLSCLTTAHAHRTRLMWSCLITLTVSKSHSHSYYFSKSMTFMAVVRWFNILYVPLQFFGFVGLTSRRIREICLEM